METEKVDSNFTSSDEAQMQTLLLLFLCAERQWDDAWNQFEKDLIYKNRFYSNSPIVEEIHKRADQAAKTIPQNTIFFRARTYPYSSYDRLFEYYLSDAGISKKEIRQTLPSLSDVEKRAILFTQLSGNNLQRMLSEEGKSSLIAAIKKWKRRVVFKGYNAKDSVAPPADLSGSQRANPDHIRYLYLSEDRITPIYEVRPTIGAHVSVAKFRLLGEIKVYDLTLDIRDPSDPSDLHFPSLFGTIGNRFSKPVSGNSLEYLPTQYLAEEIKRLGFDGLRFNSSLHKGGVNLVLFYPEICKPISSELVDVSGIEISLSDPYSSMIDNRSTTVNP